MDAFCLGDERDWVGVFVEAAKFAEFAEDRKPLGRRGKLEEAEGMPEVFAESGGDGFLAKIRELL